MTARSPLTGACIGFSNLISNLQAILTAGVLAALGGDAAAASTAARIETENNARYRNATAVVKVIPPQIKKLEDCLTIG